MYTSLPRRLSGKNFACNAGELGLIPGLGRSPGEGNATHCNILAWEIPWTEEPGGLQSMGLQKSQTQLSSHAPIFAIWEMIQVTDYITNPTESVLFVSAKQW